MSGKGENCQIRKKFESSRRSEEFSICTAIRVCRRLLFLFASLRRLRGIHCNMYLYSETIPSPRPVRPPAPRTRWSLWGRGFTVPRCQCRLCINIVSVQRSRCGSPPSSPRIIAQWGFISKPGRMGEVLLCYSKDYVVNPSGCWLLFLNENLMWEMRSMWIFYWNVICAFKSGFSTHSWYLC